MTTAKARLVSNLSTRATQRELQQRMQQEQQQARAWYEHERQRVSQQSDALRWWLSGGEW